MAAAGLGSLLLAGPAAASLSFRVAVAGQADIYGAGVTQPPLLDGGSSPDANDGTLPTEIDFPAGSGPYLTFPSVTGSVYCDGSMSLTTSPNGPCPGFGGTDLNPFGSISGIQNDDSDDFLVGVFLSDAAPSGVNPPSSLNFSSGGPIGDYTSLTPELGQTFLIGNGVTTTGQLHRIAVPAGATRLFLGIQDGSAFQGDPCCYDDNGGAYDVTVNLGTISGPAVSGTSVSATTTSTAAVSGTVDPGGQTTTVEYQYGLDPRYAGGGALVYDQSTPTQTLPGDFAVHAVTATVTGLIPNALYHFRLVASNSAGTTTGPDQTFSTRKDPPPPAPVIGKTFNAGPVSGLVLIELPPSAHPGAAHTAAFAKGKSYIPLTEARRLPIGTKIDARRGTLKLTTASFKIGKTQTATFSGGLFKLASQTRKGLNKGLANLSLLESDFPGAPSFAACKPAKASQAIPTATEAKLSAKVLQTLHASDNHGRFRTTGKHSAATVRGTVWDTTERCDGTLTTVHRGTVDVLDFGTRKTIRVHAGHHYLARANAKPPRKHR